MAPKNGQSVTPGQPTGGDTGPITNYDAEIDITASQAGAFVWGKVQLNVQGVPPKIYPTPSGIHAEAKIRVDTSVAPKLQKVNVYFDTPTQDNLNITFALALTPLDDHFQPDGPKGTYSLKWTTSAATPAFLDGPVFLKDLK